MKKWFYTRRLRQRMVLSILVVGVLSGVLAFFAVAIVGRSHLRQTIGANFAEVAKATSKKLGFFINHHIEESRALVLSSDIRDVILKSNRTYQGHSETDIQKQIGQLERRWINAKRTDPFVQSYLENQAARYLKVFLATDPTEEMEHILIMVTDQQGVLVAATQRPKEIYFGNQKWWQAVWGKGKGSIYIGDIESLQVTDQIETKYVFELAVPIMEKSGPRMIGAIRMVHYVEPFFNMVTKVKIGDTDHTMLASSDGELLFCPIFLIKNHVLRPELISAIFQDQPGWAATRYDVHYGGPESINGFAPLVMSSSLHPDSFGGHKWVIFTSQNPKETYAPINALLQWIALSGVLGLSILTLLGVYVAHRIVKPVEELQKGSRLIGSGNLNHRLKLKTGDEIEELAEAFNEMADQLKSSYDGLEQKVAERTRELEVMNKINRIISSSLRIEEVFEVFAEEITQLIPYERISIALLDKMGQQIELRMVKTKGESLIMKQSLRSKTGTVIGWVVDRAQPFIRTDTLEKQEFVEDRLVLSEGLRSYIVIPVISKQRPVGTFNLASNRPETYSEKDLAILTLIAEQLAIAVENAHLFAETKELDQLKSEFVSKVSHELRTPLTSIQGFAEILLSYNDVDPKTQREFLNIIHEESERLTRLINDVLDLSKIEAGKVEWHIQPFEIGPVLNMVSKSMMTIALEKNIPTAVEIPHSLPAVRGDQDQVIQVVSNLLSNALKFTKNGRVDMGAKRDGQFVLVYVSDTGIGIPPKDLPKIFEKFHQLSDHDIAKPKGTGLGLSICKEIITYLGGKIWCESQIGKGSTFYFTLPIAHQEPVGSKQPQEEVSHRESF